MKLVSFIFSALLASFGLAHAALTIPGNFDGSSVAVGNTFAAGLAGGSWTDDVFFTLSGNNVINGFFQTADLAQHNLDVLSVSISGGTIVGTTTDTTPGAFSFALGAGTYHITAAGNIVGTDTSTYAGLINAVVNDAPPPPVGTIPEPGTYAMLMAGLFAMGFVVSRRRKV